MGVLSLHFGSFVRVCRSSGLLVVGVLCGSTHTCCMVRETMEHCHIVTFSMQLHRYALTQYLAEVLVDQYDLTRCIAASGRFVAFRAQSLMMVRSWAL